MFHPYRHTQRFEEPFSFDELYRHPGPLGQMDQPGERKRIGILGGGIAGLASGYELGRLGHDVTILEASKRPGGRIRTHRFSDGTHGELGAMRIPTSHRCVLHYIREFALPVQRFVSFNPAGLYHLRGKRVRMGSLSDLFDLYDLAAGERQDPGVLYDDLLHELVTLLSEEEKWEMFSPTFESASLKRCDALSFTRFFRDRLSREAFELMGHATGMIHYERVSLLGGFIDFFSWYRADQIQLTRGMEALVDAFLERLRGRLLLGAEVTAVQMTERGVRVHWGRGDASRADEFDYVICTVPAPALARIAFDPALPPAQRRAIEGIRYSSATKTLFHCTARPWELHDGIYGGGSFTDLPMQQCWYPADNARLADAGQDTATAEHALDPASEPAPQWVAVEPERSHQPAVLTAAYRWEENALRFSALDESERSAGTLRDIRMLHPGMDRYVDDIVHCCWDGVEHPGAYAFFGPGEHERFQEWLCLPYPAEQPRIFFAGEHLAVNHASIQGAIQTALSAAIDVLQAPPRPGERRER